VCTLIAGVDALGPASLVVAANRDEDPYRPSLTPGPLWDHPRVVGGRDAVAGGTWLAVREREAVVAILNRRPRVAGAPSALTRSRGLLALDLARFEPSGTPDPSEQALELLRARLRDETFAPFALAWLAPGASWVATHEPGSELQHRRLDPGWHVLTHEDLDDVTEPRTRRLRALLQGFEAPFLARVEERLLELLALHDQPVEGERGDQPPVCLHAGRMVTVSSALVSFVEGRVTYRHIEGRPCTGWPRDYGHLLAT
jgi:uncharacterized protein with NRDE domain